MKPKVHLFLAFLLTTISVIGQIPENNSASKLIAPEKLDQIINDNIENYNISGLSACIIKGGETIWKGNYGYSNIEANKIVDDSTIFLLYSITKTFTGIGLMQLVENGLIDLDDPINDYLPFEVIHPDYPAIPITVKMLMTHTSGIKDNWTVLNSLMIYNEDTDISLEEFLTGYLVEGGLYYSENESFTNSQPGLAFSYSNIGASLCGFLIEVISEQPYSEYIQDSILIPLEMNNTSIYLSETDTSHLAIEYSFIGDEFSPNGFLSNPVIPAGFIRSTCGDMAKYLQMIINRGKYNETVLLDSSLMESMIIEAYPNIAPNSGLLFGYDDINDLWGHTGGYNTGNNNKVKTAMFFDKNNDWGVVLLSNGHGEPWQILYMLYQYAKDFIKISPCNINIIDENLNSILESEENTTLEVYLTNNSITDLYDIEARLTCENPLVNIIENSVLINNISAQNTNTSPISFSLKSSVFTESFDANFLIKFIKSGITIDSTSFNLLFGTTEILIIDDEEHLYKSRVNAGNYYHDAMINNNKTCYEYDLNLFGIPNIELLESSEAVVWYTSLDNQTYHTIMSEEEVLLIKSYLDNGGKIYLSGQNISEALSGNSFLNNYLKCEHINDTWQGSYIAQGVDDSSIGDSLELYLSGGDGSNNLYSISSIDPTDEATKEFKMLSSDECVGIAYTGDYQMIFTSFCLSAISNQSDRNELMRRILEYFELSQNIPIEIANSIFVFPNPVINNTIIIESIKRIDNICLIDLNGKKIIDKSLNTNTYEIDVSTINPGIYIIMVNCENDNKTVKIVIE